MRATLPASLLLAGCLLGSVPPHSLHHDYFGNP